MSLGGGASTTLQSAVANAWKNGAANGSVLVAAAGNDGNSAVNYPAGYAQVISVGGDRRHATRKASFSNANADVEVAAPGVDSALHRARGRLRRVRAARRWPRRTPPASRRCCGSSTRARRPGHPQPADLAGGRPRRGRARHELRLRAREPVQGGRRLLRLHRRGLATRTTGSDTPTRRGRWRLSAPGRPLAGSVDQHRHAAAPRIAAAGELAAVAGCGPPPGRRRRRGWSPASGARSSRAARARRARPRRCRARPRPRRPPRAGGAARTASAAVAPSIHDREDRLEDRGADPVRAGRAEAPPRPARPAARSWATSCSARGCRARGGGSRAGSGPPRRACCSGACPVPGTTTPEHDPLEQVTDDAGALGVHHREVRRVPQP